ncbi:MAG: glutamate racemase [Clostridia bacterium]|nr:glutamate racemase [Clostridia bacterium]
MKSTLTAPIAVFDSGVGGIGVLREVKKILPHENLLYFGDNANAPYGERPSAEILSLVLMHAERLLSSAKALVLACNTATAVAVEALRDRYPTIPIIGIEPAIKPALTVTAHPRILILATSTTLREKKLQALLSRHAGDATFYKCAAPRLVQLIEAGLADSSDTEHYLTALLAPFEDESRPDAVVLGCTHFPLAKDAISRVLGADMPLFDGAAGTARELARRLAEGKLLSPSSAEGRITLTTSAPRMLPLYQKLLDHN